ncbi:MAG: peptidylprolyl isomerase [Geodermatophilaceae bacterium]|nr:peptidylprolyl isomerase [Geodermatophilaceae bacterium]
MHDALTQGEVISPEDVQTVFSVQYEGFPRGRQLLTETEALANEFLSRIEAGQSFDQLILDESTDPRAAVDNGYIGGVAEGAQVQDIVDAINGMADGEFSVVESQFGWHVLQRLAPPTLAEVEPEIRANLLLVRKANAGQAWLTEIRAAADVALTPGYGAWDTQFGAVVPAP